MHPQYPRGQRRALSKLPDCVKFVQKPVVTFTNVVQSATPKGQLLTLVEVEDEITQRSTLDALNRRSIRTSVADTDMKYVGQKLQLYATLLSAEFVLKTTNPDAQTMRDLLNNA
jgi:hypothetical protein